MRWIVWLLILAAVATAEGEVATLTAKLASEQAWDRWEACQALAKLGPEAKAAVPALIKALGDKEVCADAATALGKIAPLDPKVRAALVAALDDAPLYHRREIIRALDHSWFHPELPWLLAEVRTNAHDSAYRARGWIKHIVPLTHDDIDQLATGDAEARVKVLYRSQHPTLGAAMLHDRDAGVREAAALLLIKQEGAVPMLIRALPDPDQHATDAILRALRGHSEGWGDVLEVKPGELRLKLEPVGAMRLLVEHMRDERAFEATARDIAARLTEPPDAVLRAALEHENAHMRRCGALLLGYLASDKEKATAALRALQEKSKDDPWARAFAEDALKRLGAK